jgi:hypothetical protein
MLELLEVNLCSENQDQDSIEELRDELRLAYSVNAPAERFYRCRGWSDDRSHRKVT